MNQPTRYEIALINPATDERYLVAYSIHRSRRAIIDTFRERWERIEAITNAPDAWASKETAVDRAMFTIVLGETVHDRQWELRFTGRTQREAKGQGEYDFIGTAAANA